MIIAYLICIVFIILGSLDVIENLKKSYFRDFKEIKGYVVDCKKNGSGCKAIFAPIIEFEVNSEKYRHVSTWYSRPKAQIGKMYKIMYNPEDPTDNVIKNQMKGLILVTVGIVFMGIVYFGS